MVVAQPLKKTRILQPEAAVQKVWTSTGAFANAMIGGPYLNFSSAELVDMEKNANDMEKDYLKSVIPVMDACLRDQHAILKWRELNFSETDQLRDASLDSMKENKETGLTLGDYIKGIPTATFTGAGGVVYALSKDVPSEQVWFFGFVCGSLGLLIQILLSWQYQHLKVWSYVKNDYDRSLYFVDYVRRVRHSLNELYTQVDEIHNRVFGSYYEENQARECVDHVLDGLEVASCRHIHKHIADGTITPTEWPICESGIDKLVEACPFYMQRKNWFYRLLNRHMY